MYIDESVLKQRIKDGRLGGAYIFAGDEDYLKRYYTTTLKRLACPDEAFSVFNYALYDGTDIDLSSIEEDIKSAPMMGDFKLIEWRYAELDKMKEKEKEALLGLAELVREYPYAIFVIISAAEGFDPGTAQRPSKLAARLAAAFELINFERSTDAKLAPWLKRHFDSEGVKIKNPAIYALIERSGHGMQVLKNEVEKLSAYAKASGLTEITEREVLQIASFTSEADAFGLSNAVTDRSRKKAFAALADLKLKREDSAAALAIISRTVADIATVSALLEDGFGARDIEGELKWKSGRVKVYMNAAERWGATRLSLAMQRLRRIDAESKNGGATGMAPIEIFITEFL